MTETATGMSSTIVQPAKQPIPLKHLKPGTNYTVQARSVAKDGRNSDFSSPTSFQTGFNFNIIFLPSFLNLKVLVDQMWIC